MKLNLTHFLAMPLFAALMLVAGSARAQQHYVQPTEGILLPSPSITEVNDASAIATNPAHLGFLGAWSLVYGGSWVDDQTHLSGQGHGLYFALPAGPLGFGIATEFLLPPDAVRAWQGLDKRARLSLAMSINPMRSIGIGIAYRTFLKYDLGDRMSSLDLSLSIRPINQLALAFTFSDVNKPDITFAPILRSDGVMLPSRMEQAHRRFNAALTIRPMGNDRLAIGGEMTYLYGTGKFFDDNTSSYFKETVHSTKLTGLLSIMLTDGITLRTRFGAEGLKNKNYENGYFLDAALVIDSIRFPFGIAASPYFKLSPEKHNGFEGMSWALRISGDEAASVPLLLSPAYVVPIAINEKMDTYAMSGFLYNLERIKNDKSVNMVLLKPSSGVLSLSQALEIRRRVQDLNAKGIDTACYIEDVDSAGYIACSAAKKIWVNPAGGIFMAGLSTHAIFFKKLMDKIGVKGDIIRIGEYKSAPETFTETKPSKESAYAMNRYLDSLYTQLLASIGEDRDFDNVDLVKITLESGPFVAKEALSAGLADEIVGQDQVDKKIEEHYGTPVFMADKYGSRPLQRRTYLDTPAVAVLHIEGDITQGESVDIPFIGVKTTGAKTITKQIHRIRDDATIKAVVLKINSPGGSAIASDIIWRELMALREQKPIVATLGAVAASGGYYVASAADIIYAEPTTLTGSIGVFYGKADISEMLDKIGISTTVFKRGSHSDMQSWTRPYTDEERKKLTGQLTQYYDLFLERVAKGRGHGFTKDKVDKRAKGRIWSGIDAKRQLLVDELGGYQEALNHARALGYVSQGTKVFHYPKPKRGLLQRVAEMSGMAKAGTTTDLLMMTREMKNTVKALFPFAVSNHAIPQARLPFALTQTP